MSERNTGRMIEELAASVFQDGLGEPRNAAVMELDRAQCTWTP